MDDKRATSAAMAAASDDVSLNLDIPIHDYDLPTSAKVYSIQVILRDTLEKLDIVANLTAPKDTKAAIESVMQALDERQATENDFLQTVQQRSEQGASIRAQQANAATLKETLIAFRGISRKLTQKLSSESATSAQILHAKLRKEKLRLLAILLRTAKELKSTGACPTLFKTVADDKNRESRLENTVKYIAALNENIGKLEKAIAVESEARIKEESNAKIQLQRLKDQLREMKTDLQVAQRFEEAGSKAQINTIRRTHSQMESALQLRIRELRESCERENKAFTLSEDFLLRKQKKADEQLQFWSNKSETEIKELTDRLEKMTVERERTIVELRSAEETFKREFADKEARLEAARRKAEELRIYTQNVIIVQKMIRGFIARRRVAKMIKEKKAAAKKAAADAKGGKDDKKKKK